MKKKSTVKKFNFTVEVIERGIYWMRRVTKSMDVPTRPRSKRMHERKMKIECLKSYVKSLGLSPAQLRDKISQLKYSRDYSFLNSDNNNNNNNMVAVEVRDQVKVYAALTKALNQEYHKKSGESGAAKSGRVVFVERYKKENDDASSGRSGLRRLVLSDDDDDVEDRSRLNKNLKRKRERQDESEKSRTRKIRV